MKRILVVLCFILLVTIQSGCVVRVAEPVVYAPTPAYYAPPVVYSEYYIPPVGYYNVGGGYSHAPAHAARPDGPTPFEVVFGKGALKQPHNKFDGRHGGGNNHGNNRGGHGGGNDNRGNRGSHR